MATQTEQPGCEIVRLGDFNGTAIQARPRDRYVNATQMCKATGKLLGHYLENKGTKAYLKSLSSVIGIPITELVQVRQGGSPEEQGTWVHPRVATHLAQWCSVEFALQVSAWLDELLTTGVVTLTAPPPVDCLIDEAVGILPIPLTPELCVAGGHLIVDRGQHGDHHVPRRTERAEDLADLWRDAQGAFHGLTP